jgi:signal peptidase I
MADKKEHAYFIMSSYFFRSNLFASAMPWASIVAALPVVIWTHDSFYTLCRVRGSSMGPTLKDGDVVLVRRSDHAWQQQLRDYIRGRASDAADLDKQEERDKVKEFEKVYCSQTAPIWLVRKPPIPATGDIVVFRDPAEYPAKWNIKRVIGLGGQVVRACRGTD